MTVRDVIAGDIGVPITVRTQDKGIVLETIIDKVGAIRTVLEGEVGEDYRTEHYRLVRLALRERGRNLRAFFA